MSRSSQTTRLLIVLGIFSLAVFFFFNFRYADAASLFNFAEEHEPITESDFRQIAFPTPSPSPTPEILHTLVGSYYLSNENIDAKLLLNNKGNEPLVVQPTLYNKQGQELQVAPVTVEPQAFRFIDISDWAALGGSSFKTGNIKLLHYGKDLVLGAQIYLTDHARSLSYEEKLAELGKFDSRIQEAVWWMPSANADVRVVLTNTSDAQISVVGKLGKKPNTVSVPRTVNVPAHGTRTINLREDFPGSVSF